jgi:hypothetical protein
MKTHYVIYQLWIRNSASARYYKKSWEYNGTVHRSAVDFEKAYDSGEKYCTIFSLYGISMELVRLIKMLK